MNDYISKPVDPQLLYATLGRYLGDRCAIGMRSMANDSRSEMLAIDLPESSGCLDVDWGLKHVMGDRSLFRKLLLRFLQEHADDQQRLLHAQSSGDRQRVATLAHTLAGVAGGIGARILWEKARALEVFLGQSEDGDCDVMMTQVVNEHQNVIAQLQRYSETLTPEPVVHHLTAPVSPRVLQRLFAGLAGRLESSDSRAQKYVRILEIGVLGPDDAGYQGEILKSIKAFDFEVALLRLQAFAETRGIGFSELLPEAKLRAAEDAFSKGDIDLGICILGDFEEGNNNEKI